MRALIPLWAKNYGIAVLRAINLGIATGRQSYLQVPRRTPCPSTKPARKVRVNTIKAPRGQRNARKFKT